MTSSHEIEHVRTRERSAVDYYGHFCNTHRLIGELDNLIKYSGKPDVRPEFTSLKFSS